MTRLPPPRPSTVQGATPAQDPRRTLKALAAAGALACAALGSTVAQAQSLQALYEAARGYDATLQSARTQAEASGFKAEQSLALRRPSVSVNGSAALAHSNTPWSNTLKSYSTQAVASLTAQQSLYNRGNDSSIAQAQRGIEVAQAQLAAAEQDLIVRTAQAYFDVLSAADALATVQASKRAISEQLASARRNFEVGTATITDTREAEARFDLARAQELAADNELNTARLALDQLTGSAAAAPLGLAKPLALPPVVPDDVDAWVRQAEDLSPSLRQLRLALEVAKLETEKARAAAGPTLGLNASVADTFTRVNGTSKSNTGVKSDFGPTSGSGLSASVGVQLSMPIYSGGSIQNRLKETLALEDKARTDLEAARRSITQGVRTAFFGVRSQAARVEALKAAEASSMLALEATQLGYKVGVRVNLDVLNAQTQLYTAQRDLAKARHDLLVNQFKLRQAAGVLQAQDVAAVDALLAR